jgi:hypothetical protein
MNKKDDKIIENTIPLIQTDQTKPLPGAKYIRPQFSGETMKQLIAVTNDLNQKHPDMFFSPVKVVRKLIEREYQTISQANKLPS